MNLCSRSGELGLDGGVTGVTIRHAFVSQLYVPLAESLPPVNPALPHPAPLTGLEVVDVQVYSIFYL